MLKNKNASIITTVLDDDAVLPGQVGLKIGINAACAGLQLLAFD